MGLREHPSLNSAAGCIHAPLFRGLFSSDPSQLAGCSNDEWIDLKLENLKNVNEGYLTSIWVKIEKMGS